MKPLPKCRNSQPDPTDYKNPKQVSCPYSLKPFLDFLGKSALFSPESLSLYVVNIFTDFVWMWHHQSWHLDQTVGWGLYWLWVDTTNGTMSKMSPTTRTLYSLLTDFAAWWHIYTCSLLASLALWALLLCAVFAEFCYGSVPWIACLCPPNIFTCWNPNLQYDGIWRCDLWEVVRVRLCHEGRALMIGLMPLAKEE